MPENSISYLGMNLKHSTSSKKGKVELMAPAGSFESLRAAIQAGADAVYFGIEQLNMRAKSINNFIMKDLTAISEICKEHNVKTYLTINTVIYDHDVSLMKRIVNSAKEAGIDAVIAADHAVLSYCKKVGMPLHISTQANISNIQSVEFYSAYADTVVLARELSLSQVSDIARQVKRHKLTGPSGDLIKVEVFAHGALCMAVSGKCYLSLHSHNSSANRGACIQNCRKKYTVIDQEEGVELEINNEYIMSSKDLCTIDFLDKLIGAGINILKIEGRGRSADYVYITTKCYREAIDAYYDGTYTADKIAEWKKELARVFNRGFWEGYYLGKEIGEWTDEGGSKATEKKIYSAKALKYYSDKHIGEFKLESGDLTLGTSILLSGPTTGVIHAEVLSLRIDDKEVSSVKKGEVFTMPFTQKIRPSDKLYKLVPVE